LMILKHGSYRNFISGRIVEAFAIFFWHQSLF